MKSITFQCTAVLQPWTVMPVVLPYTVYSLSVVFRYLVQHLDWLHEQLGDGEDDYYLFDCPGNKWLQHLPSLQYSSSWSVCLVFCVPGQIELYTHVPVMRQIIDSLSQLDFRLCGVFIVDSQFLLDVAKLFSGAMAAMAAMVQLELPHVNVMSKMDLLNRRERQRVERWIEMAWNSVVRIADLWMMLWLLG